MARPRKIIVINRLRKALDAVPMLLQVSSESREFMKWRRDIEVAIRNTFGDGSKQSQEIANVRYSPTAPNFHPDVRVRQRQQAYARGLESAAAILESMIDEIEEYSEEETSSSPRTKATERVTTNEVFVVHGRDDGAKEAAARFLGQLDLKPIVLHEQPNQGRTIIEKFEDYGQVGFAVALLTPDDECIAQDGGGKSRYRARQNVILELGYFIGKLGRDRTCALILGDVEIPSDYDGVLYIKMDDGGAWKQQLIGEMKSAGLAIDANLMYTSADGA